MTMHHQTLRFCSITLALLLATVAPAFAINDPTTGRWITRDPLHYDSALLPDVRHASLAELLVADQFLGAEGAKLRLSQTRDDSNLYQFVQCSPLTFADWTGTCQVDLHNCSIIQGFPNCPDDVCTWTDNNGNPITHRDIKDSPCFAGDWPGITDVFHCRGHTSACRCYRQITWLGNPSFHVCFHDDDGDGNYDCFDGHQDQVGCCIGKGLFGECIWDLCMCLWHIILET